MTQKAYLMNQHRWLVKMKKYKEAKWLLKFLLRNKEIS